MDRPIHSLLPSDMQPRLISGYVQGIKSSKTGRKRGNVKECHFKMVLQKMHSPAVLVPTIDVTNTHSICKNSS